MPTLLHKALAALFVAGLAIGCAASPKPVAKPTPVKADCKTAPASAKKVDPASEYLDLDSCPADKVPASQPQGGHR